MKKYLWILLALFKINIANAMVSGNDLLRFCNTALKVANNNYYATNIYQAGNQHEETGYCMGYIQATADIMYGDLKDFCLPLSATNEQFARIVTKYLKDNPDKLNYSAISTAFVALNQAFPCKK